MPITMSWTDWRGKEQVREVKTVIDAKDFRGTPLYPWLIIAANPHLSAMDIWRFFDVERQSGLNGIMRPRSWIQRKRWMSQQPGTVNAVGTKRDLDGKDAAAKAIMRSNPEESARNLVRLLKQHGIDRGRDWVWRNRLG